MQSSKPLASLTRSIKPAQISIRRPISGLLFNWTSRWRRVRSPSTNPPRKSLSPIRFVTIAKPGSIGSRVDGRRPKSHVANPCGSFRARTFMIPSAALGIFLRFLRFLAMPRLHANPPPSERGRIHNDLR